MNTLEIDRILFYDEKTSPIFVGTMASDRFRSEFTQKKTRCLFVINNNNSFESGEHWLAIHKKNELEVEFFDSFGLPLWFYPSIERSLVNQRVSTNTRTLQDIRTNVCGDYCVLYCLCVSRGISMTDFVDYWMIRKDRDKKVRSLIKDTLNALHLISM